MTDIDYGDDGEAQPAGDNLLASINAAAHELQQAEERLETAQDDVKEKTLLVKRISEVILPELMTSAVTMDHTTLDGLRIQMAEKVRASILVAQSDDALAWLEEQGYGHLIKRQIIIEFGREDEAWAKKFLADCAKRKKPLLMTVKRAVHANTLTAFVKDCMKNGIEVPDNLFSIFRQNFVKLSRK
jgi:hypothetical protein